MSDTGPPAPHVQGLSKTYADGFTAVAGLDPEIPDGAFSGPLGPNGAGKATPVGSACDIARPTTGTPTVLRPRSPGALGMVRRPVRHGPPPSLIP
ncbi:hypothetical protein [Streptomyces sp. NPDC002763]|uniref:hypothetical protein n=1 Tax=Streptomyces sp. NPDC002763 TaxID=3154427 RepID=UPI0033276D58